MDSDHEIPASQQTAHPANLGEGHRKKRKNLSLRRRSTINRSRSDEPSTSRLAVGGSSKINIYLNDGDDLEPSYRRSTVPVDFDIYESARILERGNVPLSQDEIRARRAAREKWIDTQDLISVRQLMELEQKAAASASAASSKYQLETQMPGISDSQFKSVCNLLDEAHLLIEDQIQFSEWPLEPEPLVDCAPKAASKIPESAQAILNDFETESEDDSTPNTPPRLILKKPNRKYTRTAMRRSNASTDASVIIEAAADVSDSVCGDDIDLNASFMIQKNMADLSVIFESQLQPQKIELELNDIVFEQGSQSGDEPLSLSSQTSDSDECEAAQNETNAASLMLSEDDDIFYEVATPRIPSTVKRVKRKRELMTSEFAQPAASTPSTSKAVNKGTSLHPKRLRFDSDKNPVASVEPLPSIGFASGFKTARGTGVGISAQKMKNSAKMFDEIMAEFDQLPMVEERGFSSLAGFKSASKVNASSPAIDESLKPVPSTPNGFSTARRADPTSAPSTSTGFTTARRADIGLPRIEQLAEPMPAVPSAFNGFKTGRGHNIQGPSDMVKKKSMKLLELEQDDDGFDFEAIPKKHGKWEDEFDTSTSSNANAFGGFTTAVGTSINVSADTFRKYAALFEEEINADLFGQCEADASVAGRSTNAVAASPFNKFIPANLVTSTPNVAATKIALDHSSLDFLEQLDEQEIDRMFSVQTPRPLKSELGRTCLTDRFSQSTVGSEFDPTMVSARVKTGRKEALVRQQANCLRKNNIRPQPGALRKRKSEGNKMALKELGTPKAHSRDQLAQFGVPTNVINVNIENVDSFKFEMWRYHSKDECMHNVDGIDLEDGIKLMMDEDSCVGFDELSSGFLDCDSVDPKLVPDNWIRNSFKWIVLKLAGLERSFPQRFAGKGLTPVNVMLQLKYRYDREIDRSERSAIRKIVEQDDAASKPLVLFVSRIKKSSPVDYSMELSDGWYGIGTGALDPVLTNAVHIGKIRVGTKLLIQDSVLIGVEEACSPLEMPASTALKFSANSTRRVKWDTRLGYFTGRRSIPFPMKSIEPQGGHICILTAFVVRIYPKLFVPKSPQTSNTDSPNTSRTVIRSEKIQRRLDAAESKKRFDVFEALFAETTAEVDREYEAKRKESAALPKRPLSEIDDAEELWQLMERSHDAESFESDLSSTQKTMVSTYRERINEEKQNEISARVKEKFDKKGGSSTATPLLKIRIVDCDQPAASRSAILSVWNADECNFDLRENSFVEITSVCANGLRGKDLLITANGRTKIRNIVTNAMTDAHITVQRKCYRLADLNDDSFKPYFNEFDVVARVLHIEPVVRSKFQTVYLVDSQRNILHVKFWKSIGEYAFDDVIEDGKILAIGNLDWRPLNGKSKNGWPQAFVSDLTTFSANPKSQAMIERLRQLTDCFSRMTNAATYLEECMSMVHERRDSGNSSVNSTTVLSVSNSSPMGRTFTTSKTENVSKSRTKMKIERLKVYKSPPPTPAMNVSHASNSTLRKPFKCPMPTAIPINQENET